MKCLPICFLLFFCLLSTAQAQFVAQVTQRDWIGNNDLWYPAVFCIGNNCVALAIGGADGFPSPKAKFFFLRSTDGGLTWSVKDSSSFRVGNGWYSNPNQATFFSIDSQHIVLVGHSDTLFETFNGGDSWLPMIIPTSQVLDAISFSDPMNGFAVTSGSGDSMMTTSNGGVQWGTVPLPLRVPAGVAECHTYGEGKYRLFEYYYGRVFTTMDNWQTVDSTDPIIADTSIVHKYGFGHCTFGVGDTIFAYGNYFYRYPSLKPYAPLIAKTIDGGHHWTVVYNDTSVETPGSVHALSDMNRDTIIAGLSQSPGAVLMSTNRGDSWRSEIIVCNDTDFIPATNAGVGLTNRGDLIGAYGFGEVSSTLIVGHLAASRVMSQKNTEALLYPNPAAISVKLILGASNVRTEISIVNQLGILITHFEIQGEQSITWDTRAVANGTYFARYVAQDGPHVVPIIVAH